MRWNQIYLFWRNFKRRRRPDNQARTFEMSPSQILSARLKAGINYSVPCFTPRIRQQPLGNSGELVALCSCRSDLRVKMKLNAA